MAVSERWWKCGMRSIVIVILVIFIGISTNLVAQVSAPGLVANAVPGEAAPRQSPPEAASPDKRSAQFSVPIVADQPDQILALTVEGADRANFPSTIAARIFKETVRGFTTEVNSTRPPAVRLKLLVSIGGTQNYLEQIYGSGHDAVITLSQWDDIVFSRLLVRAVRASLLTDEQLDGVARAAVLRARDRVDVSELKAR